MIDWRLILPPGDTVIRLNRGASPLVRPADPRREMVFAVTNRECNEE